MPTKFERSEARDDRVERDRENHAIETYGVADRSNRHRSRGRYELSEADRGEGIHEMDAS